MKSTNGLLGLISIVLIGIALQLMHIKWALRGENPFSNKPRIISEQIVEVVGLRTSAFEGLGSTAGYIIKMPDGSLKEVPYSKILNIPSMPHKQGDWKPKYFNVLTEDGKITMACHTEIDPF